MIFGLGNSLSLRNCGLGASYRNLSNCGFVRSRLGRIGIAGISVVVFGFYVHAILSIWRADWLQDEHDRHSLEASARLEPWDAQTYWRLGRYFLYAAVDPTNALLAFRRAVKLNRYDAHYWLDLAAAYELGGDSGQARRRWNKHCEPNQLRLKLPGMPPTSTSPRMTPAVLCRSFEWSSNMIPGTLQPLSICAGGRPRMSLRSSRTHFRRNQHLILLS